VKAVAPITTSYYDLAAEAGLTSWAIDRFMAGEDIGLMDSAALCRVFGLALVNLDTLKLYEPCPPSH
jgi:hypothetical protein